MAQPIQGLNAAVVQNAQPQVQNLRLAQITAIVRDRLEQLGASISRFLVTAGRMVNTVVLIALVGSITISALFLMGVYVFVAALITLIVAGLGELVLLPVSAFDPNPRQAFRGFLTNIAEPAFGVRPILVGAQNFLLRGERANQRINNNPGMIQGAAGHEELGAQLGGDQRIRNIQARIAPYGKDLEDLLEEGEPAVYNLFAFKVIYDCIYGVSANSQIPENLFSANTRAAIAGLRRNKNAALDVSAAVLVVFTNKLGEVKEGIENNQELKDYFHEHMTEAQKQAAVRSYQDIFALANGINQNDQTWKGALRNFSENLNS